ncbi:DinB family protein [Paenibacillus koleovorans]|uniref:DinB family protein n=1 Tax=Paenibacillus koleovorans TaxID=121608 RepID=UPI0013E304EC|nr:DinB family protein [Paenibacillus koleovorans]
MQKEQEAGHTLETTSVLIDFLLKKYRSEKQGTLQVIGQLTDADIVWAPTPESNSIANLVAHIGGTVHQRIEAVLLDIPDTRDREKEFEPGLVLTREQALDLVARSFDRIIEVLEQAKANPGLLLRQPYLHLPPLTNSGVDNQATVLEILLHQFRHLPGHTGQIVYIAKMRIGQLQW